MALKPLDNQPVPPAPVGELVRTGSRVDLRRHTQANRALFVRWYQDAEIAEMLRHDLEPLTEIQARSYFDSIILPASVRGTCWAVYEHGTDNLVGSTAIVDLNQHTQSSMFRLVIGEKCAWGRGYGTEATDLALAEAFLRWRLRNVNLEVFTHNPRAVRAYSRVGFRRTGQHSEWVTKALRKIDVIEMTISREDWLDQPHNRWS